MAKGRGTTKPGLTEAGAKFQVLDEFELIQKTADSLAEGKATGWFQGRMEYGPRALGNRPILGDPRSAEMQKSDAMSSKYNFSLSIYLLHPMQDLVRQTHRETADAVRSAAPGRVDVIDTAVALLNDPAQFFFPFDGHLNPKGAGAIADFLLDHTDRDRD